MRLTRGKLRTEFLGFIVPFLLEAEVDGRGGWEITRPEDGEASPSADLGRILILGSESGVLSCFEEDEGVASGLGNEP